MSTLAQIDANRRNATLSTGPTTREGKLTSSRNAIRHGLFTSRLLLDDEDPAELDELMSDLATSLSPVGPVEHALVERIAIAMWRQRRLVAAETAELRIDRRPAAIARAMTFVDGVFIGNVGEDKLRPFCEEQRSWCEKTIAEWQALNEFEIASIKRQAPNIYGQMLEDAEDSFKTVEELIEDQDGGVLKYITELVTWCQEQLAEAVQRAALLELAEQLRTTKLVLPMGQLAVIARYQTTLDNQLYKALRALREAQDWRAQRERTSADNDE
ncbi:MAG: hypothetical protein AAGB04_06485 [Pseudomonadota bacterium]